MRIVVAAEPGRLRDGLLAMLDSFLASETVVVVDDGPGALEAIQAGRPDLAIVDGQLLDGGTEELVRAIKQGGHGTRSLVVAERLSRFRSLLDAGADGVLLRGFSAAELAEAVRQLTNNAPV